MIDLRRIRYFVVLAEELHFGRAAERLSISQPPLSQQIRVLEQEFELQLFVRTNRRVELTQAGTDLLPEARRLLAQAERLSSVALRAQLGELGRSWTCLKTRWSSSYRRVIRLGNRKPRYRYRFWLASLSLCIRERSAPECTIRLLSSASGPGSCPTLLKRRARRRPF